MTHAIENALDGTDRLRNIEKVEFADGGALNVIVGTPYNDNGVAPQGAAPLNQPVLNGTATDDLILGLAGADVLNGLGWQRHPRRRTWKQHRLVYGQLQLLELWQFGRRDKLGTRLG